MKNTEQEIWLQKSSNHFRKAKGLKIDLDKLVELRGGSSFSGQGGREGGRGLVYLRHREKPGQNVVEGVCQGIWEGGGSGRNQKKKKRKKESANPVECQGPNALCRVEHQPG